MSTWYNFKASGVSPNGVKFNCTGHVMGPTVEPGAPIGHEIFEAARDAVLKHFPGAVLKGERPEVTIYPTVRRLKGQPYPSGRKRSRRA